MPNMSFYVQRLFRIGYNRRKVETFFLQQVVGKAEVWLNNRKIGSKMTKRKEDLLVEFPAVKGECDLRVLLTGEINSVVELKGNVMTGGEY